jgi:Uma2 family endonuclease
MAETDLHRRIMIALLHALEEYYRKHSRVYVSGNIFIYYHDEAGLQQSVSPDVFVVFGAAKGNRRIYKLEDEGKAPQVVIELTSTHTKVEDVVTKHYIYAGMGVREYFLFDPYTETMHPALRGFRLEGGEYVPMANGRRGASRLRSEVLGLELRVEQGLLRLFDPKTGEFLRSPEEAEEELRVAKMKLMREAKTRQKAEARAAKAEAENARLREELARLRGKKP